MRAYIVIFALALVRAVFVTFAADTALSLPWVSFALDGIFVVYSLYWLLKRNNNKAFNFLYILPIFGSVLFEYQYGLVALLLFSPFIYLLYRHKNELSNTSLLGLIVLLLKFVLYPLWIFVEIFNSVKSNKSKVSVFNNYSLYVVVGVSVGLLILGALALLDPEFAKWLANIEDILEFLGKILLYLLGYTAAFLWFIYGAATVSYETATVDIKLASVLRWGALVSTAVFVGYSLYDVYIVLRVLKVIELAFETMGKNTQLYFVEMVVMGGLIFFLISFILEKINSGKAEEHEKNHSRVFKHIVIITSLFLLPPIYNLLRALLGVYIPEFGLTVRRLFGIYSATAFLITFAFVVVKAYSKSKSIFAQSLVVFFLTLQILAFVLPNNLIIYKSQISRYLNNKDGAIEYLLKLDTGKWSKFLSTWEHDKLNSNDTLLKWAMAQRAVDLGQAQKFKNEFISNINSDVSRLGIALDSQNYFGIKQNYIDVRNSSYIFPYLKPVSNVNLASTPTYFTYNNDLNSTGSYKFERALQSGNLWNLDLSSATVLVHFTFENLTGDKTLYLNLVPTTRESSLVKIDNSGFTPLWLSFYDTRAVYYSDITEDLCRLDFDSYAKSSKCSGDVRLLVSEYDYYYKLLSEEVSEDFMSDLIGILARSYGADNFEYTGPLSPYNPVAR